MLHRKLHNNDITKTPEFTHMTTETWTMTHELHRLRNNETKINKDTNMTQTRTQQFKRTHK